MIRRAVAMALTALVVGCSAEISGVTDDSGAEDTGADTGTAYDARGDTTVAYDAQDDVRAESSDATLDSPLGDAARDSAVGDAARDSAVGDAARDSAVGDAARDSAVGDAARDSASVDGSVATVTFSPTPLAFSGSEVANPMRGMYLWYKQTPEPAGWPVRDSYHRYSWRDLESTQGTYTFTAIENELLAAKNRGGRFGFGIMTVCTDGCTSPSVQVPEYIKNTSNGWFYNSGTQSAFIPDWNNSVYLQRWNALMTELGKRYNADPRLGFVDIRGYGNWGEWHNGPYDSNYPRAAGQTRITEANAKYVVDATINAFPNKLVMMLPQSGDVVPRVTAYALSRSPRVGMRLDCLGYPRQGGWWGMDATHKLGTVDVWGRWKTGPIITEWCNFAQSGTDLFVQGLADVKSLHVSLLSSGNYPGHGTFSTWSATTQNAFRDAHIILTRDL